MKTTIWDQSLKILDSVNISCTKAFSQTIANAAAVTADGGNQTTVTITGHGYLAGSNVYFTGSTNYDGLHLITAKADDNITIQTPFVVETFSSDTARFAYLAPVACEVAEFRIHLSAAPTTVENLVITIDDARGSAYDTVILTKAMNAITDYLWVPSEPVGVNVGDLVVCTYTNTDSKTLGAELKMRRIAKPGIVRN
jgi:hypothetical protein